MNAVSPELEDATLIALAARMSGDTESLAEALDRILELGGQAMFAATCGWAGVVADAATRQSPPGDGPFTFELSGDSPDRTDIEWAARFVVAFANDDGENAVALWAALPPVTEDDGRAVHAMMTVLDLAAATAQQGRSGQ